MFTRIRKAKTTKEGIVEYVYLVENRWNPIKKKHEQKIIASLGRRDRIQDSRILDKVILALKRFSVEQRLTTQSLVIDDLEDEKLLASSKDYGVFWLTEKLLAKLSFDKIIKVVGQKDKDKKLSLENITSALVALISHRLTNDSNKLSELSTFNWFEKDVFLPKKPKLDLNHLYRSLDFLAKNKDEMEKQYYYRNQNLFNQKLDLVLFDTTSIYYWGEKGEAGRKIKTDPDNALLRYGFSKDHRSDLKQLIVGVLMAEDAAGRAVPVAHETFPGNQVDLVSFPEIINKVKARYKIKRIIFIADKGTVSEENLRQLEDENTTEGQKFEYILGVRVRKLPPALKKTLILNIQKEDMKKIKDNLYSREFKIKDFLRQGKKGRQIIKELTDNIYKNLDYYQSRTGDEKKDKENIKQRILKRRYFVCFNPFVAQDNQIKRKFFRKVIANKIKYQQNKQWIIKNGYKKYLKIKDFDLELDQEKLNQEQDYDGKWILITNNQTMSPNLATLRYKTLRAIEQGFKDLKSLIKTRPIYHFKEDRIKAHVFVAFLALVVKWYLYQRLDSVSQTTGRRLLEAVNRIKAIQVDKESQIWVRTQIDKQTLSHLKILQLAPPQKLLLDKRRYIKPKERKQTKAKKHGGRNLTLPLF